MKRCHHCRGRFGLIRHRWGIEELGFSVELYSADGSLEEVVARCATIPVAQAAFQAACS
jgi:hypothetical protein